MARVKGQHHFNAKQYSKSHEVLLAYGEWLLYFRHNHFNCSPKIKMFVQSHTKSVRSSVWLVCLSRSARNQTCYSRNALVWWDLCWNECIRDSGLSISVWTQLMTSTHTGKHFVCNEAVFRHVSLISYQCVWTAEYKSWIDAIRKFFNVRWIWSDSYCLSTEAG